jgi:hypothetical protein
VKDEININAGFSKQDPALEHLESPMSPRIAICLQARVAGQISRRRKKFVVEHSTNAMVKAIDHMNKMWSKI